MSKKTQTDTQEVTPDIEEVFTSIEDVLKSGDGLVDSKPVKKKVTWKKEDGTAYSFNVFVRKQSFKVFSKFIDQKVVENDILLGAQMISSCLAKDELGKTDLLTYEKACELHPALAITLINAIHEVNSKKN